MSEEIVYLAQNEIKNLLSSIDNLRDRAIITLFLNTGVFLNELIDLQVDSVDWEKKILKVLGNRARTIPLDEQAYEALAKWTKERPEAAENAFFVTTKGEVKKLSARAVDKLIRKYADQAKIHKKVNSQILRNTFAVRLFKEEISLNKATAVLGISDPQSINRYIKAAKDPAPAQKIPEAYEIGHVESRSKIEQVMSKLFSTQPKITKPVVKIEGERVPSLGNIIYGRDGTIEEIKSNLSKEQSVLLVGKLGIGKTHILKHILKIPACRQAGQASNVIFLSSPSPMKNLLTQVCGKLKPNWKEEIKSRASTKEILDYLIRLKTCDLKLKTLLIIDNLQNLRASDVECFLTLLENFTVLSAVEEITPKLKQVWWKFKQIELNPLSKESAKQLIKYLTQNLSVSDYELLETRILSLSNCLPLAIVDMAHQISHKPVVTKEVVREMYHEAGIYYRDWTPVVVILWAILIMFRFIALGTHSFEGYILAGFGMAFIMVMRFFMFRMR